MRSTTTRAFAALLVALVLFQPAAAISTKKISGRYFVDSDTGEPFFLKGVDYQPGGSAAFVDGSDPLSDPEACARDVYLMQQLGVNAIRIYSVDPTLDHDECMSMLASAGIYLVLDVNTPIDGQHIYNNEPWTTYNKPYLSHVFQVIEAFSGYDNTLAYFAANEIVNNVTSAETSPHYIKAVVRDMKQYMANHITRQIPVGYSAADDLNYRTSLAAYLESGPEDEAIDFYGVNSYQWCGKQTFSSSGYDILVADYSNFSLPIFLSEFGCNQVLPRTFQEVSSIFSDQFTVVFSGGLVYEYSQETSNYGLVSLADDGTAQMLGDYEVLSAVYESVTLSGLATATASARPTSYASSYPNIDGDPNIPDTLAADLIANGLGSSYNRGKFVDVSIDATSYTILDVDGNEIKDKTISQTEDLGVSGEGSTSAVMSSTTEHTSTTSSSTRSSATSTTSTSSTTLKTSSSTTSTRSSSSSSTTRATSTSTSTSSSSSSTPSTTSTTSTSTLTTSSSSTTSTSTSTTSSSTSLATSTSTTSTTSTSTSTTSSSTSTSSTSKSSSILSTSSSLVPSVTVSSTFSVVPVSSTKLSASSRGSTSGARTTTRSTLSSSYVSRTASLSGHISTHASSKSTIARSTTEHSAGTSTPATQPSSMAPSSTGVSSIAPTTTTASASATSSGAATTGHNTHLGIAAIVAAIVAIGFA